MNNLLLQNPPAFLVAIFFVLPFLSLYAFWRIRQAESVQWLKWNNVRPLPLSVTEAAIVVLLVGFAMLNPALYSLLPVIASASALVLTRRHGLNLRDQWGLDPARFPACFRYSFNTLLAIILPLILISGLAGLICEALGFPDAMQPMVKLLLETRDPRQIATFLLLAVVFAPIWEEMFFRGIVYPWLKSKISRNAALLITSLFFAAIHQHVPSFLPLAFLGAALALSYEYTGSLVSSIVLHALFNFATCLNLLLMRQS